MRKNIKLSELKQGEVFKLAGINWIVLDQIAEETLCLAENIVERMPYDEDGVAIWSKSSIRKYLDGDFTLKLEECANIVAHDRIIIADDGTNCETSVDQVFLLTCEEYRKYRNYITDIDSRWWTATPYSSKYRHYARYVNTDGSLSDYNSYYGNFGARPAFYAVSNITVEAVNV